METIEIMDDYKYRILIASTSSIIFGFSKKNAQGLNESSDFAQEAASENSEAVRSIVD